MKERRKPNALKSSPLPDDYIRMVTEVFTAHFDAGLKAYGKLQKNPYFAAEGEIYSDEIVLTVSLLSDAQLAATTVYASTDFDPKASAPTAQELLSACVDATGTVFGELLDPDNPEILKNLAEESLSALKNVPFEWTPIDANQRQVFVKLDKSNPKMDRMADDWLMKNDPDFIKNQEKEQKETEKLFVTGPRQKGKNDPGTVH